MTADEALEHFSAAHDGELPTSVRAEFEAVLAKTPELAREFAEFQALLYEAASLEDAPDLDAPDLLPAVQQKLRTRSRGRFYRDRFSTRGGRGAALLPLVLGAAMLVVLAVAWIALHSVEVEGPGGPGDGRAIGRQVGEQPPEPAATSR